jgi:hypothetical protein
MPSLSLQNWKSVRRYALDDLESAHRSLGGTSSGRRYATQQINRAYAGLFSSQFQGFCRDSRSESTEHFVRNVPPGLSQDSYRNILVQNRKPNAGNPNPGHIESDYNR